MTSTAASTISTWPVGRPSLIVPSGRAATVPVTLITYSLRTSTVLSTTHWMIPLWSRRSTKARCSPCSRRRFTHPANVTV